MQVSAKIIADLGARSQGRLVHRVELQDEALTAFDGDGVRLR